MQDGRRHQDVTVKTYDLFNLHFICSRLHRSKDIAGLLIAKSPLVANYDILDLWIRSHGNLVNNLFRSITYYRITLFFKIAKIEDQATIMPMIAGYHRFRVASNSGPKTPICMKISFPRIHAEWNDNSTINLYINVNLNLFLGGFPFFLQIVKWEGW